MSRLTEKLANLSAADRRALLAKIQERKALSADALGGQEALRRVVRSHELPLSFAQQRLWFFEQLNPGNFAYNMPTLIRLTGPLSVHALQQTWTEVARRQESLLVHFATEQGRPSVHLSDSVPPDFFTVVDLSDAPQSLRLGLAKYFAKQALLQPFSIESGPLFRVVLLRLSADEHIVSFAMHHIASDGWSLAIMGEEVTEVYGCLVGGSESSLRELRIQYADFAVWQRRWLAGDTFESQLDYWRKQLSGDLPALELPTDSSRSVVADDFEGADHVVALGPALSERVRDLSRAEDCTVAITLCSVFMLLLHRLSGEDDVIIGMAVGNRNRHEIEKLIGFFVNSLAIRIGFADQPAFRDYLRRVRDTCLDAYAHQDLPFERMVEEINPNRSSDRQPVFDILFNALNIPRGEIEHGGLMFEPVDLGDLESKFAMTVYAVDSGAQIEFHMAYRCALFSQQRIAEMGAQLQILLQQAVTDVTKSIGEFTLRTPFAKRVLPDPSMVLEEPTFPTVPEQFALMAVENPDRVAVRHGQWNWTYGEMLKRVTAVAEILVGRGVGPGDVVAIMAARSFGLYVGMTGILASGGVMLTLDPILPDARRRHMLAATKAKHLVLVSIADEESLGDLSALNVVRLAAETGELSGCEKVEPGVLPKLNGNSHSHIFFTSGTTGEPKGVLCWHKSLSQFVDWERTKFEIGDGDRSAQLTGLSFNPLMRDVFVPLTSGATLCPPETSHEIGSGDHLRWFESEGISVLHTVPSIMQAWLRDDTSKQISLGSLRWIFSAGEPLRSTLVSRWREQFPASGEIVLLYGATETPLAKCFYQVPQEVGDGLMPVGKTLPHTQGLVLGNGDRLCGMGEPGEVCFRTPFGTLGYVNDAIETKRKFVTNPFRDDQTDIMYRTGDWGRYDLDGRLHITGRRDHQLKINGIRIELAEVSTVLERCADVNACVVVSKKNERGEPYLIAYWVAAPGKTATSADLRTFLIRHLLPAMVPSVFVKMDALPLNPSGKVDRSALPDPEERDPENEHVAPRNATEETLAGIWSEVLGVDRVGVNDSFFELGGHSLLGTQVISRVRERLGVELPLRQLFETPTVAGFAEAVEKIGEQAQRTLTRRVVRQVLRHKPMRPLLPLTDAQKRFWLMTQLRADAAALLSTAGLRLRGELVFAALLQAVDEIRRRHEIMRTRYPDRRGVPTAQVLPIQPQRVRIVDLSGLRPDNRCQQIDVCRESTQRKVFALKKAAPVSVIAIREQPKAYTLMWTTHHILFDAWSHEILGRECSTFYSAFVDSRPSPLEELPLQYADYAVHEQHLSTGVAAATSQGYWRDKLVSLQPLFPVTGEQSMRMVASNLSTDLIAELEDRCRSEGASTFVVILAGLNALLASVTGVEDIAIGTVIADRQSVELEAMIGFFVKTIVLRNNLEGDPSFSEIIRRVRQGYFEALEHPLPFSQMPGLAGQVGGEGPRRLFDVLTVLLNQPKGEGLQVSGLNVEPMVETKEVNSEVDVLATDRVLSFGFFPHEKGLHATLEYAVGLFTEAQANELSQRFVALLGNAVRDPTKRLSEL